MIRLWDEGLISVDANILLSLYDLSPASRTKLLGYFDGLDDGRLWVAHQAMVEFHRHRLARREQVGAQLREVANNVRAAAKDIKRQLGRYASLVENYEPLAKPLEKAASAVDKERTQHLKALGQADDDSVVRAIEQLFEDKVGRALPAADVEREGDHRFAREIPPGFADAEAKGLARRYGDLHIWLEMLAQAKAEQRPVMFLTEDGKDDWWWNAPGRSPTPRPELRREMYESAGVPYWQYTLDGFLRQASQRGLIPDEDVADEVEELREGRIRTSIAPLSTTDMFWLDDPSVTRFTTPYYQPLNATQQISATNLIPTLFVTRNGSNAVTITRGLNLQVRPSITTEECTVTTPSGLELRCQPKGDVVRFPEDFGTTTVEHGPHEVAWTTQWSLISATGRAAFSLPLA